MFLASFASGRYAGPDASSADAVFSSRRRSSLADDVFYNSSEMSFSFGESGASSSRCSFYSAHGLSEGLARPRSSSADRSCSGGA